MAGRKEVGVPGTKLTNLLKKVPDEARASEGTFFLSGCVIECSWLKKSGKVRWKTVSSLRHDQ